MVCTLPEPQSLSQLVKTTIGHGRNILAQDTRDNISHDDYGLHNCLEILPSKGTLRE
jgi:hypothetical protein